MKNLIWIIALMGISSCRNENKIHIDYYELAMNKKMSYADSSVCPIDEKLISNEICVYTDSLYDDLEGKIIEEYYKKEIHLECLPTSEKEYFRQKNEWKKNMQKYCDSLDLDCGAYYYCDVQTMDYYSEQTRNRIKAIENCINENDK